MECNAIRPWTAWVNNPKTGQSMKVVVMADTYMNAKTMIESQYNGMTLLGPPQLNG